MNNLNKVKEHYQELENIEERIKNDRREIRHRKKNIEVLEECLSMGLANDEILKSLIVTNEDLIAGAKYDLSQMELLKLAVKESLNALIEEL